MNKLFKGLTGITLGLALCFGFSFSAGDKTASMAKADNTDVTIGDNDYTLVYSTGFESAEAGTTYNSTRTYDANATDGISWSAYYGTVSTNAKISGSKSMQMRWYGSAKTNYPHAETTSAAENVKALKFNYAVGNANLDFMVQYCSDGSSWTDIEKVNTSGTSVTSYSYEFDIAIETFYFRVLVCDGSAPSSGNYNFRIDDVCFGREKQSGGPTTLSQPSPVFDKVNKQITWDDIDNATSYTVLVDNENTYTNATSPFSVSTLEAGVMHNVKVTAIGDGTNYSDSNDGEVSFAFLDHAGTEADPYSVNDARLAIDMNDGITGVYAEGKVSAIVTAFNSQYGNISYNISTDGLTTSPQLQAFRGKSYNGVSFTSNDDIQVGDTVVVKGDLTKHNSTYEFAADNQLVSLVRPQAPVLQYLSISGTPSKTTYKTTDTSWNHDGLTVNAHYDNSSVVDVTSNATWLYDIESPAAIGEGDFCLTITASYGGESTDIDVDVTIEAVVLVDTYHLSGRRYIYEQVSQDAAPTYMNIDNASGTKNPDQVSSKGQASVFLFTLVGDDTYRITNLDGTKGLYYSGTKNELHWGTNGKEYDWVVNDDAVVKTVNNEPVELYGTYNFVGKDGNDNLNRYICAYGSDWRTYNAANAGNRTAKLQVEVAKDVAGFSVDTSNANKNVLKGTTFDAVAAEAARFEPRINYTDNSYDVISCDAVEWVLETSIVNSEAVLYAHYLTYDVEITGMNVYAPTMVSLSINATNAKTSYLIGDNLDISGVVITAHDASNNDYSIEISQCTFSPANGDTLTAENTSVTVSYENENGSFATGSYAISVNAFTGFTKITSVDDLEVGASYVIGVDTSNPTYRLMGSINDASATKSFRNAVDASSVMSTDATRVLDTANSIVGASTFTLLKNDSGKYAFYDMGNSKFVTGLINDGDNHLTDSDALSNAAWWSITFSSGKMSATLNGTNRVLGYNYNNNSDPRFATYNAYTTNISHIALFKMDGSSVKTSVEGFTNDWLKMNDSNYDGDIETPSCAENYGLLKLAYADLNEAEKNILQYCDDFAPARARLNAWATANGETFTYGAAEPFAALKGRGIFGIDKLSEDEDNNVAIILFMVATLGVGALSAFYLVKKRKRA